MDDRDNLCPECNGQGWISFVVFESYDHQELGWDMCVPCDGTGKIATIPTEEEAGEYNPWEADEYERWLDSL